MRVLLILQNHYATLLYDSSNLPIAIPFNYFNRIQSIFLPCRRIIILFQQPFDNTPHSGTSTLLHIPVDRFVTPECIRQLTCNSDQLIVGIEIFYSLRLGQRIIKGKFFAVQIKRLAGLFAENDLTGYFQ